MEPLEGIEPSSVDYKATVFPLNYEGMKVCCLVAAELSNTFRKEIFDEHKDMPTQ